MNIPRTIQDIERLIELEIPESIHLDYKASPALCKNKKDEICKDVSAFANSDGGVLIYGVKEEHTIPTEMDSGIDTSQINKEWIDEILATNISPIISGLEIIEIKKTANSSIFVVNIPKSFRGPHQAPDKRYYKRYNARSAPMEHYEINDVRNRRQIIPSLISVDVQIENPLVQLIIENTGKYTVHDLKFIFSETFSWYKNIGDNELPHALKNGIKFFPARRKMMFSFGDYRNILNSDKEGYCSYFDISVSYLHPQTDSDFQENFYFDLRNFLNANFTENHLEDISINLKELKNIVSKLNDANNFLKNFKSISGATGINLSISTLMNLSKMLKNDDSFQQVNFPECTSHEIKEILNIDLKMANNIFFITETEENHLLKRFPE